jgi:hypothetical protein
MRLSPGAAGAPGRHRRDRCPLADVLDEQQVPLVTLSVAEHDREVALSCASGCGAFSSFNSSFSRPGAARNAVRW